VIGWRGQTSKNGGLNGKINAKLWDNIPNLEHTPRERRKEGEILSSGFGASLPEVVQLPNVNP
jgi:hypothetical protein